jgi:hypothetical protein
MRPTIGTLFTTTFSNPWVGPCPSCGKRIARKRPACADHKPVQGTEVTECVAEVTKLEGHMFSYTVVEVVSMRDPLPTNPLGAMRVGAPCGMTYGHFEDEIAAGRVTIL